MTIEELAGRAELFTPDDAGTPAIVIVPPRDDVQNDAVVFDLANPARFARFTGRLFGLQRPPAR